MFLQNLRAKIGARLSGEKSEAGFTLIELLVVMLILGILAAIAIPAFFNQRQKASDAQSKAAARTAETAMETYATESGGSYSGATPTKLHEIEPTLQTSGANAITIPKATATEFEVTSTSGTSPAHTFTIAREGGGTVKFSCLPFSSGGCPASPGDWSK
ncbi:MAG TPA: type II secretion system protein [Solirubrobacterales bacterium]|nr:type II secretion system protein [Solirubrobacterales bacterium]